MTIVETRSDRATMMRGSKIRIYPNQRQTQKLDLWRRRTLSLWNLLLNLEHAAYSGENTRSKLGWRSIWRDVEDIQYKIFLDRLPGLIKGADSEIRVLQREKDQLSQELSNYQNYVAGFATHVQQDPVIAKEIRKTVEKLQRAIEKKDEQIEKAIGKKDALMKRGPMPDIKLLPKGQDSEEPKVFIWEHELQKIMARLKQVPRTEWIGDLPSHAAQAVVKDLVRALQTMLRDRKKRLGGEAARDTGFPKFKKSRYAAGSIYFANTQLSFDFKRNRVKFPNQLGEVAAEIPITIRLDAQSAGWQPKLMGGRAWREGEKWFLSCQWEVRKPTALPATGRTAGVKIAAAVLLTTYDDRGQTKEYTMPPPDPRMTARHRRAGQWMAHVLTGQRKKEDKLKARKLWQQQKAAEAGKTTKPINRPRVNRSGAFYEAAARLADIEATQRNIRDDFLHKLTTDIVKNFDVISVQKMNVASMMEKPSTRKKRRAARKLKQDDAARPRRDLKPVRKLMRHVAMARCQQLLAYKMRDLRGEDAYQEIAPHDVNASACSSCGTIHEGWQDGRRLVRCNAKLPDGSECGTVLPRNRNAARLTKRELDKRKPKAGTV